MMSIKKDKIDELIKETLSQEEAAFYDELEEQSLMGKMGEVYKGKLGWLAIIMNVVHLLFFIVFVFSIVQFMGTDEITAIIRWASLGFLCLIAMGMLKLYVWMQMDKNDILRELKRLELQLASYLSKSQP
jgi:hypothetical protein